MAYMEKIGRFIVKNKMFLIAVIAIVTAFLGWRITKIEENYSFETLYLSNDPHIDFAENFAEEFDNVNNMIAIAITGKDLFTTELLTAIQNITERIERLSHVDTIYSFANIRYIDSTDDGVDVCGFLEEMPQNQADCSVIRDKALDYPLFRGRLISKDGKYLAIVVQTYNVIDTPADPHVASLIQQLKSTDAYVQGSAIKSLNEIDSASIQKAFNKNVRDVFEQIEKLKSKDQVIRKQAVQYLIQKGHKYLKRLEIEDRRELVKEIETIVEENLPAGYKSYISGTHVIERDYAGILRFDRTVFQIVALIVLAIAFYFSFQSLWDAAMAMISLGITATCALGIIELIGGEIDIVNSVCLIMILIIGTSDIIHMTFGFYKEHKNAGAALNGEAAAVRMVSKVGYACFMTSLTTSCGFFSLYFARIRTISQFGLNMGAAILVTYVISLLTTTIFLTFRKDFPPELLIKKEHEWINRIFYKIVSFITVHYKKTILISTVCLLLVLSGMQYLNVETHAVGELEETHPTKINVSIMENLAGFIGFEVSVQSLDGTQLLTPEYLAKIEKLQNYLEKQPETLRTWSVIDYLKKMNSAANNVDGSGAIPSSIAEADQYLLLYTFTPEGLREIRGLISNDRTWVRIVSRVYDVGAQSYLNLRDRIEEKGSELFKNDSVQVKVTSEMTLMHEGMNRMVLDLVTSMTWAFVLVGIIVMVSLRSVKLGFIAILPNIIPILATLGFMGWTGIYLRVGTLVVFSIGLGIAVDDTMHYLICYARERPRSVSYTEAIMNTHLAIGKPMLFTSIALIAGFLCFTLATFKSVSHMGILNSFTMLVALLADLIITPVLLRLIEGRGNKC